MPRLNTKNSNNDDDTVDAEDRMTMMEKLVDFVEYAGFLVVDDIV